MDVCLLCFVLPGRGLCDELITPPEESYRFRCVVVCDLETSWMRRSWPFGSCCQKQKTSYIRCLLCTSSNNVSDDSGFERKTSTMVAVNKIMPNFFRKVKCTEICYRNPIVIYRHSSFLFWTFSWWRNVKACLLPSSCCTLWPSVFPLPHITQAFFINFRWEEKGLQFTNLCVQFQFCLKLDTNFRFLLPCIVSKVWKKNNKI